MGRWMKKVENHWNRDTEQFFTGGLKKYVISGISDAGYPCYFCAK